MKRLVSSAVALLALAALMFGQVAVGFSQGPIEREPAHRSDDTWSAPVGDSPWIADELALAGSPAGDKKLFSEIWPRGASPAESNTTASTGPEQETLYSIADACILEGYPTVNLGSTVDMWAGYDDSLDPEGKIVRSLVKFDISSLPSGKTVEMAKLRLYLLNSWDFPDRYRLTKTYRITSNWSESSVTWSSKPGSGESHGQTQILHTSSIWVEFDVTALVQSWYDGTYPNHGILVRGEEVAGLDSGWRSFSTREGSNRPQLVVTMGGGGAPVISGLPDVTLPKGSSKDNAVDLWAYTHDDQYSDSELTFSIDNSPASGAGISIGANRYLDIFPDPGWSGQTTVAIRVTNPLSLSDTDSLLVRVQDSGVAFLPLIRRDAPSLAPHEPNNTFGQAWGPLASGQVLRSNFPMASDVNDFFFFQMSAEHSIEVRLDKVPYDGDYDIYLYDNVEGRIGSSTKIGLGSPERITVGRVPAGKYYIRVTRAEGGPSQSLYELQAVYK